MGIGRGGHYPGPAAKAETAERRKKAVELRLSGMKWDDIAQELGYASAPAACTSVRRAMEEARKECHQVAEDLIQQTIMRYDELQAAHWPKALAGNQGSAKIVLQCLAGRARIEGVDMPKRIEVSGIRYEIVGVDPAMVAGSAPAALTAGEEPGE